MGRIKIRDKGRGAIDLSTGSYKPLILLGSGDMEGVDIIERKVVSMDPHPQSSWAENTITI